MPQRYYGGVVAENKQGAASKSLPIRQALAWVLAQPYPFGRRRPSSLHQGCGEAAVEVAHKPLSTSSEETAWPQVTEQTNKKENKSK